MLQAVQKGGKKFLFHSVIIVFAPALAAAFLLSLASLRIRFRCCSTLAGSMPCQRLAPEAEGAEDDAGAPFPAPPFPPAPPPTEEATAAATAAKGSKPSGLPFVEKKAPFLATSAARMRSLPLERLASATAFLGAKAAGSDREATSDEKSPRAAEEEEPLRRRRRWFVFADEDFLETPPPPPFFLSTPSRDPLCSCFWTRGAEAAARFRKRSFLTTFSTTWRGAEGARGGAASFFEVDVAAAADADAGDGCCCCRCLCCSANPAGPPMPRLRAALSRRRCAFLTIANRKEKRRATSARKRAIEKSEENRKRGKEWKALKHKQSEKRKKKKQRALDSRPCLFYIRLKKQSATHMTLRVTMLVPCDVAASAQAAQKTLGKSMLLASTTARFRMSPTATATTTTTAMLSTRRRGSKPPSMSIRCAAVGSCDIGRATGRSLRARSASTALHATASDSIEIAAGSDDDDESSPRASSSSVPADLVEVATFGAPHGVRGEVRIFPVTDEPEERLLEGGAEAGARFWVAPQLEAGRPGGGRGGRGGGILIGRGPSSSSSSGPAVSAAPKPRLVRIESARPAPISRSGKKGSSAGSSLSWLLKLRGIDSPEAAAALANNSLWMSAAERPALPETGDDFYAQELIGMEAIRLQTEEEEEEKVVGVVVDVCGGGGGTDLLRLELSDDEEEEEEEEGREEVELEEEAAAAAAAAAASRSRRQQQRKTTTFSVSARRTVLLPFTQAFVPHVDRAARKMTICPPDGLLDLAILPPKAQLKQQEQEAAALAAAAAGTEGGGLAEGGGKKSRPRRPRGRKARDRAGGGTAAPPSA